MLDSTELSSDAIYVRILVAFNNNGKFYEHPNEWNDVVQIPHV